MTEWNDRQGSAGVGGATIRLGDGADRAVLSVDEERASRACLLLFYASVLFLERGKRFHGQLGLTARPLVSHPQWLGAYFTAIRPLSLKRQGEAGGDQGCFFLGTTGLPVANPRADLHRLWRQ